MDKTRRKCISFKNSQICAFDAAPNHLLCYDANPKIKRNVSSDKAEFVNYKRKYFIEQRHISFYLIFIDILPNFDFFIRFFTILAFPVPKLMALLRHCAVVVRASVGLHFALPLPFLLLFVSGVPTSVVGLSCFQGLANLSVPLGGSATQCPGMASACVKTVDYNSRQVTRSCLATNCTVQVAQAQIASNQQQATSTGAICINNTASTFCCCYGDGCNSALSPAMASLLHYSIPMALLLMVGGVLY